MRNSLGLALRKGLKVAETGFARTYAMKARNVSGVNPDVARKKASEILEGFYAHPAQNHELFSYLKDLSKEGMTPEQFLVYRDNFFYRTQNTILSVSVHAKKAIDNNDYEALANVAKNFSDEGGHGDPEEVHLKLLEKNHNKHGTIVYGVPPITISDSKNSPFLTDEVRQFRKTQEKLFRSSYPTMTGCLLAHEAAADQMLINFRNTIFEPYSGYYTESEYKTLMKYYDAHRDDSKEEGNVEEQHKEQALLIASNMITASPRAENLIILGGTKFLQAQSNLWSGLMKKMQESRSHGQKVPPKSDYLSTQSSVSWSKDDIKPSESWDKSSNASASKLKSDNQIDKTKPKGR